MGGRGGKIFHFNGFIINHPFWGIPNLMKTNPVSLVQDSGTFVDKDFPASSESIGGVTGEAGSEGIFTDCSETCLSDCKRICWYVILLKKHNIYIYIFAILYYSTLHYIYNIYI
jgi:hypothetical protein